MRRAQKKNASAVPLFVSVVLLIGTHNCSELPASSGNLKQRTVKKAVDGDVKLRIINHAACKLSLIKINELSLH